MLASNKETKAEARRQYRAHWRKQKLGSSTPGRTKCPRCQASPLDKFFARYSRGHRYSGYDAWLAAHRFK